MPIARLWAGRAYGTHTGNIFVKLHGSDNALSGTFRVAIDGLVGTVVYNLTGRFDGANLTVTATVAQQPPNLVIGDLTIHAALKASGNLAGEWHTSSGAAGTLVLFPHDNPETASSGLAPDQFHTARHQFRAIDITREQIIALGDEIQQDFLNSRVVVTITDQTEQSRFLDNFKQQVPNTDRAKVVKLHVSEPDGTGVNKSITIEFGQQWNGVVTQGGNERWVLGSLERLKRIIQRYERAYTANAEWYGIGLQPILLLSAIAFLSSLDNLRDRFILLGSVFALNIGLNWLHLRYLPHTAIYLTAKREGFGAKVGMQILSWVSGIAATVIAALVLAYLKGWLKLPGESG